MNQRNRKKQTLARQAINAKKRRLFAEWAYSFDQVGEAFVDSIVSMREAWASMSDVMAKSIKSHLATQLALSNPDAKLTNRLTHEKTSAIKAQL